VTDDRARLLTQRFAEHRDRLTALAYRILGSRGDAEDAMQESWLRVSRADGGQVENPAGWLTTVVAGVFVLHDVFDVPFGEVGAIIDRSPVAARQLARA
jgi:hypothetical protein